MRYHFPRSLIAAILAAGFATAADAHVSYTNRDFGTFSSNGPEVPVIITGQSVSSNFGWADATDDDFGDSHRLRAFRFTLTHTATITLQVSGMAGLLPAFSLYEGLAHVAPSVLDHDASQSTLDYLFGLGGVPKEGAFVSLGDWAIGNEPDIPNSIPASLSQLTYIGHAADGTAANFGSAAGIAGDGVPDGLVAASFALAPGTYSLFVGGAEYSTQGPVTLGVNSTNGSSYTSYGITASLTVIPEPSATALIFAATGMALRRKR